MSGTTLVELMVSLAILGLLAGLAAASLAGAPGRPPGGEAALQAARASAIRSARRVAFVAPDGGRFLLLPDGRVIGPGIDPLTGEVAHVRR